VLAILDRFPVVARKEKHQGSQLLRQFCSFLVLFAMFHQLSCPRCSNQKYSSQGAPCSAFTLGTVPQYHPHATETMMTPDSINEGRYLKFF
jgi:hypothetical protein